MHDNLIPPDESHKHWNGRPSAAIRICPNPIFVIGSPRSGTTALSWALAKHSHLWTSDESQILADVFGDGHLDKNYRRRGRPDGSWLIKQGVTRTEFLGYLGLGVNALFTNRSRGLRWVDHTPNYTAMVDSLADLFPGAVFLHIVRDGRRVVNSMVNYYARMPEAERNSLGERGLIMPWGRDFTEACRFWKRCVDRAETFAAKFPHRVLTLRNEDLVSDPRQGFTKIFEFLKEPWESGPMDYFSSNRINSSFQKDSGDRSSVKKLAESDPWPTWSPDQRRIFREEAGESMIRLGMASAAELADGGAQPVMAK